ncbi:MAG: hypothetical protein WC477_04390 [Patescibacteria group bacterium]
MDQIKTKKAGSRKPRAAKAVNSPEPTAPSVPAEPKSVRYCGPTSQISHQHAHEAAQGVKHVWAAPIIAGLALLITATIAFNAVNAQSETAATIRNTKARLDVFTEVQKINTRLDAIEQQVQKLSGTQQQAEQIQVGP